MELMDILINKKPRDLRGFLIISGKLFLSLCGFFLLQLACHHH